MNRKLLTTVIVLPFLYLVGASEETSCFDDPTFLRNGKNCTTYLEKETDKRCGFKEDGIPISEICRVSCGICQPPGPRSESCFDDPTFRWKGKDRQNCMLYTEKNTKQRCDYQQDGILVRDSCPVACGVCSGLCFDDPTFRMNGKKKNSCAKYLKKNKEDRCELKNKGVKTRDLCRASCGSCTTCDDDPTFRWEGNDSLTCKAFTETDKEEKCGWKQDTIKVRDSCRASCGTCSDPTASPSDSPSASFFESIVPSLFPSASPSVHPSQSPSGSPTRDTSSSPSAPSSAPSPSPSAHPSQSPSGSPTRDASSSPSGQPSAPSASPSAHPSQSPSGSPTRDANSSPIAPSSAPSASPSAHPSQSPSGSPTRDASSSPSGQSSAPSASPSAHPSQSPSGSPTRDASSSPSGQSSAPSTSPSAHPSQSPSGSPTTTASFSPSSAPSTSPSDVPSILPTGSFYPSRAPSEAQFVDISGKLAKYASEELAHPFVQKPWMHFHGPMTFDINGDGFADMLSHHHVGSFSGDVGAFWDLALSSENRNNDITYTAGKVDIAYKARIPDASEVGLTDVQSDIKLNCMENKNIVDGSIVDDFKCLDYPDFHGTAVLDFDRDGKLDMFASVGGGGGLGTGIGIESMLFWGVDADETNPNETSPKSDLSFAGGRGALIDAGLSSGRPQRTYGVYFADFNNDGYLDFFPINKYRKEATGIDDDGAGHIYINRGVLDPRRFDIHLEVSQFASTAILTDFDQDGFANEFLIFERTCVNDEPNCVARPRAYAYKWDATVDALAEIWRSTAFSKDTNLVSSASGDFNGDGLTDIVILTERDGKGKLQFWYSVEGEFLGGTTLTVQFPENCSPRHSIRAADFDLNGTLDLFVLCEQGTHVIFQQSSTVGIWSAWDTKTVGALGDPERNSASTQAYYDRCFGDGLDQCESDAGELATIESKVGSKYQTPIGQGVTVFDYNNDGFVDLFVASRGGLSTLFENKGVPGNKYVSFKLQGTTSNIDGIGAILLLTWNNGVGTEEKIQLREHNAQSFETEGFGSRDSRIVFGLGETGVPLKLEIRWPSGIVSTLTEDMLKDVPMTMNYNEIMIITEP